MALVCSARRPIPAHLGYEGKAVIRVHRLGHRHQVAVFLAVMANDLQPRRACVAVSYTHLTLPTIYALLARDHRVTTVRGQQLVEAERVLDM